MTAELLMAMVLGMIIGYIVRTIQDQGSGPKELVMDMAFDPATIPTPKEDRWVEKEWLYIGTAQYLLRSPVRLDKFYRCAWHVLYLGAPLSHPYMDIKTKLLSRPGVTAVQNYLVKELYALWRDPSHHGGLEFSERGLEVLTAAARKHRPTRREIDALRIANQRQRPNQTQYSYAA